MKRNILIPVMLLLAFMPCRAYPQANLSDLSETFRIFEEARSLTAGFDLTTKDFVPSVPDDYPLGAGDILKVMAGNLIMDVGLLQVSPQGEVLIPPAGLLDVKGMTVAEATEVIQDALSIYLKDPRVEIQLVQARKIKVYLVGQVMLPGVYITFAGTAPVEFLQISSGLVDTPTPGTLVDEGEYLSPYFRMLNASASRYVKLLRDGREEAEIDLAAALLKGEPGPEVYLQEGDVIYVPEVKRPVIVRGGVVKAGKYEFARGENLTDVLLMAGGTLSEQFLTEVTVERETDFGHERILVTVNRDYKVLEPDFKLRPGDMVRVPETANYVYVMGSVYFPAAYEYKEGWRVVDYIGQAGGPIAPNDAASTVLIKNAGTPDAYGIPVNFKDIMLAEATNDPEVEPGDIILMPFQNKPWPGPTITGTLLQVATFARFLWD